MHHSWSRLGFQTELSNHKNIIFMVLIIQFSNLMGTKMYFHKTKELPFPNDKVKVISNILPSVLLISYTCQDVIFWHNVGMLSVNQNQMSSNGM